MQRLLFISHEASRTGAPILLINLARILKEVSGFKTDFLLKAGGELTEMFHEIGNTYLLYKTHLSIIDKIKIRMSKERITNLSEINWQEYDFVFANSISSMEVLPLIRNRFQGPVICYIHELRGVKEYLLRNENFKDLAALSNFFLAPCHTVQSFLVNDCSIDASKVSVLPYYIPPVAAPDKFKQKTAERVFAVGGCGTIELRKGTDLFIQVAHLFKARYPDLPVKFIWKGANTSSLEYKLLLEDITKLGLSENVVFDTPTNTMDEFYQQLDVFLLTSREDPYPLVVLEAANAKVPTVCFEKSGGAVEFIAEDAGKVVKFLDVNQMVHAIHCYYSDEARLSKDGACALQKLKKWHQDKVAISEIFCQEIKKLSA